MTEFDPKRPDLDSQAQEPDPNYDELCKKLQEELRFKNNKKKKLFNLIEDFYEDLYLKQKNPFESELIPTEELTPEQIEAIVQALKFQLKARQAQEIAIRALDGNNPGLIFFNSLTDHLAKIPFDKPKTYEPNNKLLNPEKQFPTDSDQAPSPPKINPFRKK